MQGALRLLKWSLERCRRAWRHRPPCSRLSNRSHHTREAVRNLLEAGVSRADVARMLGISRPTVTYHAKRLGFESDSGPARRYDWSEIQRYYDAGHSITECQRRFGFTRKT